jgi:hypothetical protein
MIKALLDKVGNIFEKEFLLGSFLPALLFMIALTSTFATVIGFQSTLAWLGELDNVEKAIAPAAAGVAVVVFAYVLSGIRPLVLQLWSGNVPLLIFRPVANVFRLIARGNYLRYRRESRIPNRWEGVREWLDDHADVAWDESGNLPACNEDTVEELLHLLGSLDPSMPRTDVERIVTQVFLARLKTWHGPSLLPVHQYLRDLFDEWRDAEEQRISDALWRLDRSYGSLRDIHATRLGNIIESYTSYSFKRYRIEPEVFWPHLQTVIGDKLRAALGESRTMLDFALTSATLAILYMLLCLFGGPWLYRSPWFWAWHVFGGAVIALMAYRTAVVVALQFGDLFRASFDLHRLDLLKALRRKAPATFGAERDKWAELSGLVLYAQDKDFELTESSSAGGVPPS